MSSLQSAADYLMSQSRATPRITQWRGPISLSKSGKYISCQSKGYKRITYGPNIVEFRASWFAIDGTLVQFAVLPRCRVDCVDVDHWHLLVQHLWDQDYHVEKDDKLGHLGSALDQFSGLAIEWGPLEEEPVHVNPLWWRVVDVLLAEPGGKKV